MTYVESYSLPEFQKYVFSCLLRPAQLTVNSFKLISCQLPPPGLSPSFELHLLGGSWPSPPTGFASVLSQAAHAPLRAPAGLPPHTRARHPRAPPLQTSVHKRAPRPPGRKLRAARFSEGVRALRPVSLALAGVDLEHLHLRLRARRCQWDVGPATPGVDGASPNSKAPPVATVQHLRVELPVTDALSVPPRFPVRLPLLALPGFRRVLLLTTSEAGFQIPESDPLIR